MFRRRTRVLTGPDGDRLSVGACLLLASGSQLSCSVWGLDFVCVIGQFTTLQQFSAKSSFHRDPGLKTCLLVCGRAQQYAVICIARWHTVDSCTVATCSGRSAQSAEL